MSDMDRLIVCFILSLVCMAGAIVSSLVVRRALYAKHGESLFKGKSMLSWRMLLVLSDVSSGLGCKWQHILAGLFRLADFSPQRSTGLHYGRGCKRCKSLHFYSLRGRQ